MGACTVDSFEPTDGNRYIYGFASSWTVVMSCSHQITVDFGLMFTFPAGIYVQDTSQCKLGLQSSKYTCRGRNREGSITYGNFAGTTIEGGKSFTLTINGFQNPKSTSISGKILVSILTAAGGAID